MCVLAEPTNALSLSRVATTHLLQDALGLSQSRPCWWLITDCLQVIKAIMRQVLTGLSRLHSIGIVHRDVKPDNLVITTNGQVRNVAAISACLLYTHSSTAWVALFDQ